MIFRSRLPQGSSQELTPAHSNRNDNTVESSDALKNDDEKSYQRYAETSNSGSFPAEKNTEENSEEPGRIILDCVSSVTEGNIQKEKTEGDDKTAEVKESIGSQSVADEELNEKVEDNTTVTNNSLSDIIKNITNFLLSKSNNSDSEVDTNIKRRKSSKKGRQQVVISYPASQGSRYSNYLLEIPNIFQVHLNLFFKKTGNLLQIYLFKYQILHPTTLTTLNKLVVLYSRLYILSQEKRLCTDLALALALEI